MEHDSEKEASPKCIRRNRPRNEAAVRDQQRLLMQRITHIVDTPVDKRTDEDVDFLAAFPELVKSIVSRRKTSRTKEAREAETEDSPERIDAVCEEFAECMLNSKCVVIYTGAGISTAANIPDYRGPEGIWTKLRDGRELGVHNLEAAVPTKSHMAIKQLIDLGLVKHVVSQNCDGLHFRSGIPRSKMSEVHGNMYIEACSMCNPPKQFVREFDVTEKTRRFCHRTGRLCYYCGHALEDTIVHFGERGRARWPLNWVGVDGIIEDVDLILCLGSSLKVLRGYEGLWCTDRPRSARPSLYIVNLQWTPKDKQASAKVHARCDDFMERLMRILQLDIPAFPPPSGDPLAHTATPLHPYERNTSLKARTWFAKRDKAKEESADDDDEDDDRKGAVKGDVEKSEWLKGAGVVKKKDEEEEEEVKPGGAVDRALSIAPDPDFELEPKRCPSGYFRHEPIFRFLPFGANPYHTPDPDQDDDDGLPLGGSTHEDELAAAAAVEDAEDVPGPGPGPGWYGKGCGKKKRRPFGSGARRRKRKMAKIAPVAGAVADKGCDDLTAVLLSTAAPPSDLLSCDNERLESDCGGTEADQLDCDGECSGEEAAIGID